MQGSLEESYNLLRRYGEVLKLTNPKLKRYCFFKYLFMDAGCQCVQGFLNCIKPVIVMDGTFLKNKYWSQLIVSVCLDGTIRFILLPLE